MLPWAMADCAYSEPAFKFVYKYRRQSMLHNLLHAKSDMRPSPLAYSLAAELLNSLLSHSLHFS